MAAETTTYHHSTSSMSSGSITPPYMNTKPSNINQGYLTLNAVNSNMLTNLHTSSHNSNEENNIPNSGWSGNGLIHRITITGDDNNDNNSPVNASSLARGINRSRRCFWYEEDLGEHLRWCFLLNRILHTGMSKFQDIALLDTRPWGKVLILDGKMQSAEVDEFVYHECLVHPALLYHSGPENVFIMGGGEGSTAREALRHKTVKKVTMCDIDKEVVAFCKAHLPQNIEAFHNDRFDLVINDARAELENGKERFDIVVGDLADPVENGPCYQLYSKCFYEQILKPKLNPGGIFVTQAGPAGVLSHGEVFTSIYNTLKHVFTYVVAYAAHVPSYADTWGWIMASDTAFDLSNEELDERIKQRVKGDLRFIDGPTIRSSAVLNKLVRKALKEETHVYTEESARFVYGKGVAASASL